MPPVQRLLFRNSNENSRRSFCEDSCFRHGARKAEGNSERASEFLSFAPRDKAFANSFRCVAKYARCLVGHDNRFADHVSPFAERTICFEGHSGRSAKCVSRLAGCAKWMARHPRSPAKHDGGAANTARYVAKSTIRACPSSTSCIPFAAHLFLISAPIFAI